MTDGTTTETELERARIASFVEDVLGQDPADDETAAEELAEAFNAGRDATIVERSRTMGLLLASMIREGRHAGETDASSSQATSVGFSEDLGTILGKAGESMAASMDAASASQAIRDGIRETVGPTGMDGVLGVFAELVALHLASVENDRWRSMESAPRDWSDLILFDPTQDDAVFEGHYSCKDGGADCWMSTSNRRVNPIMWKRRPSAPTVPRRIDAKGDA